MATGRFEETVLPHLDAAFNYARWLTRNEAEAEDVVQDACVRALRFLTSLRDDNARPWLLAIVRSVCQTDVTRHGQHETVAQEGPPISQLLGALPPQLRETIFLRECSRMSYREIAEVTGVSSGAVMSRLAQARAMLSAAEREATM